MTLLTSLIASAAAGISEMAIFALSVQAEVSLVVFFQAIRIVVAYATISFLVQALQRRYGHELSTQSQDTVTSLTENAQQLSGMKVLPSVIVSLLMAWLFVVLRVPAGAMLGAMTGTAVMNLVTGRVLPCPEWLRQGAQIGLSISISRHFSPQTLKLMAQLFWPLLFSTVFMQLCSLALAFVMKKYRLESRDLCVGHMSWWRESSDFPGRRHGCRPFRRRTFPYSAYDFYDCFNSHCRTFSFVVITQKEVSARLGRNLFSVLFHAFLWCMRQAFEICAAFPHLFCCLLSVLL